MLFLFLHLLRSQLFIFCFLYNQLSSNFHILFIETIFIQIFYYKGKNILISYIYIYKQTK